MTVCDGCGRPVDAEHVKARIERLQLATRFRPIHIQTLVIDACPPQTLSDFFYNVGGAGRSAAARAHFGELAHCVGDLSGKALGAETSDEAVLTEWQRRGLFLAFVVDCPFESEPDVSGGRREIREYSSIAPRHLVQTEKCRFAVEIDRVIDSVSAGKRLEGQAYSRLRAALRRRRLRLAAECCAASRLVHSRLFRASNYRFNPRRSRCSETRLNARCGIRALQKNRFQLQGYAEANFTTIESGRRAWIFAIIAVATILSCRALAQQKSDDAVPPETANFARIDKLLAQMTLEEKMDLIRGEAEPEATNQGQAGYLRGVPRLHVPSLRMADGPPGLADAGAGRGRDGDDGRGSDVQRGRRAGERRGDRTRSALARHRRGACNPSSTSIATSRSTVATTRSAKIRCSPPRWARLRSKGRSRRT